MLRAHDAVTRAGYYLAGVAVALIFLAYTREVIGRYFFNSPTTWSDDVVGYLLSFATFLALPEITRTRGHVAVTLLLDWLRARVLRVTETGIEIVGFVFCAFAAVISGIENGRQIAEGIMTMGNDPIPKWWITCGITYGLAGSALYFGRQALGFDAGHQRSNTVG